MQENHNLVVLFIFLGKASLLVQTIWWIEVLVAYHHVNNIYTMS